MNRSTFPQEKERTACTHQEREKGGGLGTRTVHGPVLILEKAARRRGQEQLLFIEDLHRGIRSNLRPLGAHLSSRGESPGVGGRK